MVINKLHILFRKKKTFQNPKKKHFFVFLDVFHFFVSVFCKQVNENQELLDKWGPNKDTTKTKPTFCFYGKRFNILLRDEDNDVEGKWLVGMKGKEVICAYKFNSIYFICMGVTKPKKKVDKNTKVTGFNGAPGAYNLILGEVWDPLVENEV